MKHTGPTIAIVLFAAACAGHQMPGAVPTPDASIPISSAPTRQTTPIATASNGSVATTTGDPKRDSASGISVSANDVNRAAVEAFGALPAPAAKSKADDSAATAPSWDIDVHSYESTDRVEHYVHLFTGPAKERVVSWLERGSRFEPMIRTKLREGGLPEDMYYLALIESGFDQNAYSRAAAVGMWQFMTSTARDMGLRVDWWVDERRDPIKSTGAAVRFIKGLNEQFGSLYLAAAAYNGGPGRIARGLTRYADDLEGTTGDDLFFALADKNYLRNETREYVPQLIAAALIAKEPERYGMRLSPQPAFVYDSVRVGASSPLAAIAHAAGADVAKMQELNPHILRGITPPKDSFFVRVPVGTADSFALAYAALPSSERVGLKTVASKKGENFASIARRAGLNARQLSAFNPKVKTLKSGNLSAGTMVLVPTEAIAAAATHVPDPSIERYSSSRSSTMHVVKSGETLSGLAKKYHTTTSALMRANGLRRALIFPGQSLAIGGKKTAAAKRVSRKGAN
ncbi:MAG TPA: transglycosylase SLT domain-containing protein [Gemmatimonadaceae bacterium]|nr:transglycosylase SLT domain-containing protein [Gemmatimonadaceae bacterium]